MTIDCFPVDLNPVQRDNIWRITKDEPEALQCIQFVVCLYWCFKQKQISPRMQTMQDKIYPALGSSFWSPLFKYLLINPFLDNGFFLFSPWKHQKNSGGVFRGYRKIPVAWNGLTWKSHVFWILCLLWLTSPRNLCNFC